MRQRTSRVRSRRVIGVATVILMIATGLTLFASSADAWTHTGCKYSGSNPTIDYHFDSVTSRNRTAIENAQARWDRTSAPGYFRPDTWYRDSEIDIDDANYSSTAWAWVSFSCGSDDIYHWNEVDMSVNLRTTANLSAADLATVMVHELGHAYGLGHSSITCSSSAGPAVMRQGAAKFSCAGSAPWTNDVNGVHARY